MHTAAQPSPRPSPRLPLSPLSLWLLAPVVASAALRDLWAPDEPRYAEVAREIYTGGSFLVMHLCGDVYPDKPPLLYWLAGLLGWLSGWSELALRVPSLLATAATAWLIARFARRWWNETAAFWAPAVFLTMAMVTDIGGRLQLDPLLTVLCTAAVVMLTESADDPRRQRLLVLGAGLATGLAMLTKGPVALVNVGLPLLAWWSWRGREAIPRVSTAVWAAFAALAVGPVLTWAIAASLSEPGLARELFFGQHLGRVTQADRHPGPPWKYLLRLPLWLLPWTGVVVAELAAAWKSMRARRMDDPSVAAALWLLALVVVYSAIPPKRDLYLLPAFPAAALLAGAAIARWERMGTLARPAATLGIATLAAIGAGALILGGLPLAGVAATSLLDRLPVELTEHLAWRGLAVGVPALAGAGIALAALRRRRVRGWAMAIAAGWAALTTAGAFALLDPVDPLKSARGLALEVAAMPQHPVEIPCFDVQPEGYRFYAGLPTVRGSRQRLAAARERDGLDLLVMVSGREWQRWTAQQKNGLRVLESQSVGGREVVVLGAESPPVEHD